MKKVTEQYVLDHGRLVGGQPAPIHLRLEIEDDVVVRAAIGVTSKDGRVNWMLTTTPQFFMWARQQVEWARKKSIEHPEGGR